MSLVIPLLVLILVGVVAVSWKPKPKKPKDSSYDDFKAKAEKAGAKRQDAKDKRRWSGHKRGSKANLRKVK